MNKAQSNVYMFGQFCTWVIDDMLESVTNPIRRDKSIQMDQVDIVKKQIESIKKYDQKLKQLNQEIEEARDRKMKIELERLRRKTEREQWEYERKLLFQMDDMIAMHGDLIDGVIMNPQYAYDPKIKKYPKELIDMKDLDQEFEEIIKKTERIFKDRRL